MPGTRGGILLDANQVGLINYHLCAQSDQQSYYSLIFESRGGGGGGGEEEDRGFNQDLVECDIKSIIASHHPLSAKRDGSSH